MKTSNFYFLQYYFIPTHDAHKKKKEMEFLSLEG